jgi:hypothetical protein
MTVAIESRTSAPSDEIDGEARGDTVISGAEAEQARSATPGAVTLVHPEGLHEGLDDHAMGQVFVRGAAVGVPALWAISTLVLLPLGLPVAALASIFVGIASGPFFGCSAFLMAKLVRLDRQGR